MNRIHQLLSLCLSLQLLSGAALMAQDETTESVNGMPLMIDVNTPADQTGGQKMKLIHVATLGNAEMNNEFKRNVAVLQRHKDNIAALQRTMQTVQDEELKVKLESELELALERLNVDNQKMVAAYGFSLNRRYEQITEKSHIYMYVTEEEADKVLLDIEKRKADSGK